MNRFYLRMGGIFILCLGFAGLVQADISKETLEKEHLARYYINYASYLIDVGKYLEALESYNAAQETTGISKTKVDAMLAKAALLSSFLDAPEDALNVYRKVRTEFPEAAEIAHYREGILLFELKRSDAAKKTLEGYLQQYPKGRFYYQAEALLRELARAVTPPPEPPVPPPPDVVPAHPELRVRMCQTTKSATIAGSRVCTDGFGCMDRFELFFADGKIRVGGKVAEEKSMVFTSSSPMTVLCGESKKRVRGKLNAKIAKGKLMVINLVDIEAYLMSVVPSENPASWPLETLKAQAVAARTYAYYQREHRKNWAYDLVDYAGDQAYGGMEKEHPRSTKAVKETTGEVLTYEGKPILAMFSANSGGHTADSEAIFDLRKPYLVAQNDPASLHGGMANWTRTFTVTEVVSALSRINIDAKGLSAIESAETGPSGRIVKIRLVMAGGKSKVLRNRTTLRRALDLPEILHEIRRDGDNFIFKGHGWGHGVGYSQWGSAYLGKKETYDKILSFYYGDAKKVKLW